MAVVRKADPGARRQAVLRVLLGAMVGTPLIVAFERYRTPLQDWLRSEPEQLAYRVRLILFSLAALLSLPLIAFAVSLWSTGTRVVTAREFPSATGWCAYPMTGHENDAELVGLGERRRP